MEHTFNRLIKDAIDQHASDIHFIPLNNDKVMIQIRVDGDNQTYPNMLSINKYKRLLIYMKFISHLDVSDRNKAQSGQYFFNHHITYTLRISTMPITIGLESVCIRISERIFDENFLERENQDFNILRNKMKHGEGLFLFTGSTGSGKSTLMYELLTVIKKLNKHIITIEDPVEQIIDGIVQVSVNEKANIEYDTSFKAILRCDPDVIMIGEIRDDNTAKQVIRASLSGHLILSTMHANNPIGAISRLLEFGVTKEQIKQGINCITYQRLLKTDNGKRYREMSFIFQEQINAFFKKCEYE